MSSTEIFIQTAKLSLKITKITSPSIVPDKTFFHEPKSIFLILKTYYVVGIH